MNKKIECKHLDGDGKLGQSLICFNTNEIATDLE